MNQFLTLLSISLLIFGELMLPTVQLCSDIEIHIESTTSEKENKSEKEIELLDGEFLMTMSPSDSESIWNNLDKHLIHKSQFGSQLIKDVVGPPPDLA